MVTHEFTAGCAVGLENLLADEVMICGGDERIIAAGVVSWTGTLESAYRCCLWSRFGSRVMMVLRRFLIRNDEELYQNCQQYNWFDVLDSDRTFAVNCTLGKDAVITHSRYGALKMKDAVADFFRKHTGKRPSVQTERPDVQLHLHLDGNQATIYVDLSGEGLHRRGYRVETGTAPLKENLAAAIVSLCRRGIDCNDSFPIIDPMCGSGTLLIEAALQFGDVAPGLSRRYFGFFGWRGHDSKLWDRLVTEATEREEAGQQKVWPPLIGFDSDISMVRAAKKNVMKAGLEDVITITHREIGFLTAPTEKNGLIICNLPYGERVADLSTVPFLYKGCGRIFRQRFSGWKFGLLIGDPALTDSFGLKVLEKIPLKNGALNCRLLIGEITGNEKNFSWRIEKPGEKTAENAFANRLRKNLTNILKWAEKQNISCFRVYDRDLPEYNLAIDIYGKWVHIQEYAPPKTVDSDVAVARFQEAVRSIKEVLQVRSDRVFLKTRQRQKGKQQYSRLGEKKKMFEVVEGDCTYLVNFTDYLDTGLFLDHRPVRKKIFETAKEKNFLNLFGYTGTASVQAAMGGALSTTTVDLSATYLQWARWNLCLNGLDEHTHHTISSDVLDWLRQTNEQFDLIFMDPPTFSNTKKEKRMFDIQKDHEQLIELAMKKLYPDGLLIFSTNFRKFKISPSLYDTFIIKDISNDTIPYDFSRNDRIHQCWEIRKKSVR